MNTPLDVFALPDGALIKTNEVYSTAKQRGIFPDCQMTYLRKLKDGRLPPPDVDHGKGSRYYKAGTIKRLIGVPEDGD